MLETSRLKVLIVVATMVAFFANAVVPARASGHLPSISIDPTLIYATSDNITPQPGVTPVNGDLVLNGSITIPVYAGVSVSYDHYTNGLIHNSLARLADGNGGYIKSPLEFRDYVDTIRLDAPIVKGVAAEIGTAYRHRICCPADSDPNNPAGNFYHDNYLGFSFTSPAIDGLGGTRIIYGIRGHASPHNSDIPAVQAQSVAAGYAAKRTMTGITQAVTAFVPVDAKHGFTFAGTYTWGAFNYFSNTIIPLYYGIYILNVTKRITKNVDFVTNVDNFVQRPQGYPFGPIGNGGVNGASLNVGLHFHYDP